MKESSTSLRWFFGVVGVINLVATLFGAAALSVLGLAGLFSGSVTMIVGVILGVIEAVGFVYLAFTLPKYLNPEKGKYVEWFVLATFAATVIISVLEVVLEHASPSYFGVAISALITWYLYHNVHKLSYGPKAPVAAATPAATAPVAPAPAEAPAAQPPAGTV